jgi:hypothetical protein
VMKITCTLCDQQNLITDIRITAHTFEIQTAISGIGNAEVRNSLNILDMVLLNCIVICFVSAFFLKNV